MHCDPSECRIDRVSKRVKTFQCAIIVDVQPVQTERDDECPDGSQEPHVESYYRRRRDDNLVEKLAEDDDVEGSEAVHCKVSESAFAK